MTLEIVYRWPDGREEVRYRRPALSADALDLMGQVQQLQRRAAAGGWESPYYWRLA